MDAIKRDFFVSQRWRQENHVNHGPLWVLWLKILLSVDFFLGGNDSKIDTVYGKNPAPPGMYKTL